MMGSMNKPADHFCEAATAKTHFYSGAAHVHVDSGNLHFALYQDHIGPDGTVEKVIVAHAIMPEVNWLALRDMAEFALVQSGRVVPRMGVGKRADC